MQSFNLIIKTKSELCVATGHSIPGLVDMEIAHEKGFPLIPGKRIKGALHGVGRELVDWGLITMEELEQLFGQAGGGKSSPLQIFDAKLSGICEREDEKDGKSKNENAKRFKQRKIENIQAVMADFNEDEEEKVLEQFTTIRTQTAIENTTGVAKPTSLRTIRTVNKGTEFTCCVVLEDNAYQPVLEKCVQGLRAIGLNRTRGLGEVVCKLERVVCKCEEAKNHEYSVKSSQFNYSLTLEQPLLIAGSKGLYHSSESWIPGQMILGAMAGMYIQDHQLGDDAHADETFARIFLRGGVTFDYAYPLVNERVFSPCPAHLQQEKTDKKHVYNIYSTTNLQQPRTLHALVHLEEETLYVHQPAHEIRMHHARPQDRSFGRALGKDEGKKKGIENPGQFFQYTALSKGQTFYGSWQGSESDLRLLVNCMKKRNGQLRLGRSRTAEYGTVTMEQSEPLRKLTTNKEALKTSKIAICFQTPYIGINELGVATADPDVFIEEINEHLGINIEIKKKFLKQTTVSGFHAKWRMPKKQQAALDAGTVLIVDRATIDWESIEQHSWGEQTGAGYGRVKILPVDSDSSEFVKEEWNPQARESSQSTDSFSKYLRGNIEKALEIEKDKQQGRMCAKALNIDDSFGQTMIHNAAAAIRYGERSGENLKKKEIYKAMQRACENKSSAFQKSYFQELLIILREGKHD
ncbi:RAMP superfamily CRISPR-associated protein [Shouchella lehensis]|uniref:RAMP superfamily CRISPR-associated protein n=1 Tax=Shouchella lehensis TaxID=300825 RepID=UPI0018CF3A3A|nr:RAMP superfamily CRISPR-associated protein [Shouchella lehensis]MBG9782993.1 hypothetical protein [Shouchella lehensis]